MLFEEQSKRSNQSKDGSFDEYRVSLEHQPLRQPLIPPQLPASFIKNIDEEVYQMGEKELEVHQRLLTPSPSDTRTQFSNPQGASVRGKQKLKAKPLLYQSHVKMKRLLNRSDHHVDEESLNRMNFQPVQPGRNQQQYTILPARVPKLPQIINRGTESTMKTLQSKPMSIRTSKVIGQPLPSQNGSPVRGKNINISKLKATNQLIQNNVRVIPSIVKKPLISARKHDAELIQKRMQDKEMQEIDDLLRRADESLARASPLRNPNAIIPYSEYINNIFFI